MRPEALLIRRPACPPRRRAARWPLGVLCAALLLTGAARAGDHHVGLSLKCSDCHVMHFSQGHALSPTGVGSFVPLGPSPNRALLRDRVNDLCLACHDGIGPATDVMGAANTGSQGGIVRAAGYLNRAGIEGQPPNGHTLDSLRAAPGSQPVWRAEDENGPGRGLTCTNCHSAHGDPGLGHPTGSQYRNLRSDPGHGDQLWLSVNDSPGNNDLSRDVFVRAALDYDESAMDWNEPDSQDSALARWCGGCHSFAHDNDLGNAGGSIPGVGGGGGGFKLDEHPVWEQDLGDEPDILLQFNSHANSVKVMSETGFWNPAGGDVTPTCVTCHRGHGNGNPDGLIFRSGTGTPSEDGDTNGSTLEHLCMQCHVEGTAFG